MTNSDELREQIKDITLKAVRGEAVIRYLTDPYWQMVDDIEKLIQAHQNQLIDRLIEGLPKPERDYSKDNADEVSLKILTACAATHNELLAEVKALLIKEREKL